MPIFDVNGKLYRVKENDVVAFGKANPEAVTKLVANNEEWEVAAKDYDSFAGEHKDYAYLNDEGVPGRWDNPMNEILPQAENLKPGDPGFGVLATQESIPQKGKEPQVTPREVIRKQVGEYYEQAEDDMLGGVLAKDATHAATYNALQKAQNTIGISDNNTEGKSAAGRTLSAFWNKLTQDPIGVNALFDNAKIAKVASKIGEDGSGYDELSEDERNLMDAVVLKNAAEQYFGEDSNIADNIGSMTAESIPFMIQMFLTKGVHSGVSKAAQAGLKGVAAKLSAKLGASVGGATQGIGGALAGTAARTPIMTQMWSDAFARMTGTPTPDITPEGVKVGAIEDREHPMAAIGRGFVSGFNENLSEQFGEALPFIGKAVKSNGIAKFFGGMSDKYASNFLKRLDELPISESFKKLRPGFDVVNKIAKDAGFHGVPSEAIEEYFNLGLDQITLREQDPKEFFSKESQLTMLGSFAITGGAISGMNLGVNAAQKYGISRGYKNAWKDLSNLGFSQEAIEGLNDNISKMTPKEVMANLYDFMDNPEYTFEEKHATRMFTLQALRYNAMKAANTGAIEEKADQAAQQVISQANPDTGLITYVKVAGEEAPVKLVGNNVPQKQDGTPDWNAVTGPVYVEYPDGSRKQIQPRMVEQILSNDDATAAAEMARQQEAAKLQQQETEMAEGQSFEIGTPVRFLRDGETVETEVEGFTPEGGIILTGVAMPISKDALMQAINEQRDSETQVAQQQPQAEEGAETQPQAQAQDEAQKNPEQTAQADVQAEPEITDEEFLAVFPKDKKDNFLFEEAKAADTVRALSIIADNDLEFVVQQADAMLEGKQKELAKLVDKEGKQKMVADVNKNVQNKLAIKQINQSIDYWNTVRGQVVANMGEVDNDLNEIKAEAQTEDGSRYGDSRIVDAGEPVEASVESSPAEQPELKPVLTVPIPKRSRFQGQTDEEYDEYILNESDDLDEIANAYDLTRKNEELENTLEPWQEELLSHKFSRKSFAEFGDRNNIGRNIAINWLVSDKEAKKHKLALYSIDTVAEEISEISGQEVTPQMIVDYIVQNPTKKRIGNNYAKSKEIARRFSDLATQKLGIKIGGPASASGRALVALIRDEKEITKEEYRESLAAQAQQEEAYDNDMFEEAMLIDQNLSEDEGISNDEYMAMYADQIPISEDITEIINTFDSIEASNTEEDGPVKESDQSQGDNNSPDTEVNGGEQYPGNEEGISEGNREAESQTDNSPDAGEQPAVEPTELQGKSISEIATTVTNRTRAKKEIQKAEAEVNPNPSEAQKEAGNYKKGHVTVQGFDITIENPKGSVRSGVDKDGKEWRTEMRNTYGYFKRTEGKDGDHIDVFVGDKPESERIFVVDQVNPSDGAFDESKVMLGFASKEEAEAAYNSNYEEGWQGMGAITEVPADKFKEWLYDGAKQRKPFGEYKGNQASTTNPLTSERLTNLQAQLEAKKKERNRKASEISARVGLFGDTKQDPNQADIFNNTFVPEAGQSVIDGIDAEITRLKADIEQEKKVIETAAKENKGQGSMLEEESKEKQPEPIKPSTSLFETAKAVTEASRRSEVVTDPADRQKILNSIAEGEMTLRAGTFNGRKLSPEEIDAMRKYVNNSRRKLGMETAPEKESEESKDKQVTWELNDVNYDLALNAYRGMSFDPEKRAVSVQQGYVDDMNNLHQKLSEIANTKEQEDAMWREIARYKDGYIKKLNALLSAESRTISPMITGPANFPAARNKKALDIVDKRRSEFLEWEDKAEKLAIKSVKDSATPEQKDDEAWKSIKRTITESAATIISIDTGKNTYTARSLIVQNLTGFLKRVFTNGQYEHFIKSLDYIQEINSRYDKPVLSDKSQLWDLRQQAEDRLASKENEQDQIQDEEIIYKSDNVKLVNSISEERVQIITSEKPSREVIEKLKASAFRWSPRNMAWQRKNTPEGIRVAKKIVEKTFPEVLSTKSEVGNNKEDDIRFRDGNSLPATITINDIERPTTNSQGEPIASDLEGVQSFWAWFNGSDLVDEQGRPIVLYRGHESNNVLDTRLKTPTFTDNREVAQTYANDYTEGKLSKSYVHAKNPLRFGTEEATVTLKELRDILPAELFETVASAGDWMQDGEMVPFSEASDDAYAESFLLAENPDFISYAKEQGHDAFVYSGLFTTGDADNYTSVEVRPFDGEQVRSEEVNDAIPETIKVDGKERPTRNSEGNFIHSTEEGIRSFYKWFGDSKVVDNEGRPLVVYHGTGAKFSTFAMQDGAMGKGVYFTSVFEEAADYASEKLNEELSEDNDMGGKWYGEYIIPAYLKITDQNNIATSDYGSDGYIYLATSPTQIKSTDNTGAFDSENDDIRFRMLGEVGAANLDAAEEASIRMDNLAIAKEMESSGKDVKVIRLATGWERGADGKWRYEVEDNIKVDAQKIRDAKALGMFTFEEVIEAPEFLEAYPQAKEMRIVVMDSGENKPFAFYVPGANFININSNENLSERLLRGLREQSIPGLQGDERGFDYATGMGHLLVHELQHAIQDYEGFTGGSDPQDIWNNHPDMVEKEAELRLLLEGGADKKDNITNDRRREAAFALYTKTVGEVEARNAARRRNLTDKQRRETLLSETEDVAREDQVFIRSAIADYANSLTNQMSERKQKQLEIILQSNPMADSYHVGIRDISDIKTFEEAADDPESFVWGDFSKDDAKKALKSGSVTVYSSTPIANGVFVSTSKNQAKDYAGEGKVYEMKVPISDVAWINGDQGQYARVEDSERFRDTTPKTTSEQAVEDEAIRMAASLSAADIEVITSPAQITDSNPKMQARKRAAKGWYNPKTGKITVVAYNHESIADVQATILHEVVAHHGLRGLLGEQFNAFLAQVWESMPESDQSKYLAKYGNKREAAEEYIAAFAEGGVDTSLFERIAAIFRKVMRDIGINLKVSEKDIMYTLWLSKNRLQSSDSALKAAKKVRDGVRFREAGETERNETKIKDTYDRLLTTRWHRLTEAYQNNMESARKVIEQYEKASGKKVQDHENFYLAENAMSSKSTHEMEVFDREYFQPIIDEIGAIVKQRKGVSKAVARKEATLYMLAKHGIERNELMNEKKETEGVDYSALEAVNEAIQALGYEGYEAFIAQFEAKHNTVALWKAINAATKKSLRKWYESGLMSKVAHDEVAAMYKYYIPLRGFESKTAEDVYDYLENRGEGVNSIMKTAKGRKSLPDDPIAHIASMAESAVQVGNRNLMKMHLLRFAQNHKNDLVRVAKVWYVNNGTPTDPRWEEDFPEYDEDPDVFATNCDRHEQEMKEMEEAGMARKDRTGLSVGRIILKKAHREEHMIRVSVNGRDNIMYVMGNPRLAQAVNGLLNPDRDEGKWAKAISNANRQLSANFTSRNPAFVVSNFFRDWTMAATIAGVSESPAYVLNQQSAIWGAAKALKHYQKTGQYPGGEMGAMLREFLENGGRTGYTSVHDMDQHKRIIKTELKRADGSFDVLKGARVTARLFEDMNRVVEDINRLATYVASRKAGRSVAKSIADAKNITLNFNRRGSGEMGNKYLRAWFLFVNPAIQSLNNLYERGKTNPLRMSAAIGAYAALGMLVGSGLSEVVSMLLGDDDEDKKAGYDDLPEWVRRNNFCIEIGGHFLTIPLAQEFRPFYAVGEIIAQAVRGNMKDRNIGLEIASVLGQVLPFDLVEVGGAAVFGDSKDLALAFAPDALKPIAQVWFNQDFFGIPIQKERYGNDNIPSWRLAYSGTNQSLVSATKWLNEKTGGDYATKGKINLNPATIEHLFEGYFGGMGKTVNQTAKLIGAGVELATTGKTDLETRNIPVVNRLISTASAKGSFGAINDRYYRLLEKDDKLSGQKRDYTNIAEDSIKGESPVKAAQKLKELVSSPEWRERELIHAYRLAIDKQQKLMKDARNEEAADQIRESIMQLKQSLIDEVDKLSEEAK